MLEHTTQYVGGELVQAHSDARLPVINPADGQAWASIPDADATDVDRAVRAAADALPAWSARPATERAACLRRLADAFEKRSDEISELITRQNGTPITISKAMQSQVPVYYRYFADLAEAFVAEEPISTPSGDALVRREPVGVVAAITAWNGPQPLIAWKVGPALAAGCTVVVKPAPEASLDAFVFAELFDEAGIPPGIINIITGAADAGAALVGHPTVRKVAFTGSVAAGKAIAEACARDLKRVTLELGGKSAGILLDDVDLEQFKPFVFSACAPNTGQTWRALTRILAPRSRYDEVVASVGEALASFPLGDPSDATNLFGPLVSARQRDRVESYVAEGIAEGAEVVVGGKRPDGVGDGFYYEPTLFRGVTNDMRIAREEIFGPVIAVIPYEDDDDAVAIANDSDYGLGGGVFSADRDRATAVARRIETGTVGVNTSAFPIQAPFGGVKNSGIGRELGPGSVDAYVELKTIFRN